jgi:hypothetical protein
LAHHRYVSSSTRREPSFALLTLTHTGASVTVHVPGAAAAANAAEQYTTQPTADVTPLKLYERAGAGSFVTVKTLTFAACRVASEYTTRT